MDILKRAAISTVILMLVFFALTGCAGNGQVEDSKQDLETIGIANRQNETGSIPEIIAPKLLDSWLGSYEQSGTLWDGIIRSLDFYIYQENGNHYGYLCVHGSESGTSCYFDERILTEIRGNQDMIEVYFLEKQQLIQGCLHEEYPDIFSTECGESKLDQAINMYEGQEILFTLVRDGDSYSVIEGNMALGKNQEGMVNDFNLCSQLIIDNICDNDKEIFLKMFRASEHLTKEEQPDYNCYDHDGELILNLYLDPEEEDGVGIYYGETRVSKHITRFDIESWKPGVWDDNKYSLIRAGEKAATALDEYQEYREYNDQGQITSFYSEGIITGWGEPSKEKLVQIEFSYRNDGTLERKRCHYNHRLYGTTRRSETFYFNGREQLNYVTAYITHGMLSDYYFYKEGKEEPIYCLTLDHMGISCYGELLKYE